MDLSKITKLSVPKMPRELEDKKFKDVQGLHAKLVTATSNFNKKAEAFDTEKKALLSKSKELKVELTKLQKGMNPDIVGAYRRFFDLYMDYIKVLEE